MKNPSRYDQVNTGRRGMSGRVTPPGSRVGPMLFRAVTIAFGAAAALYGGWLFAGAGPQDALAPIAAGILRAETYRAEIIAQFLPAALEAENQEPCRQAARHDAAILRLRIAAIAETAQKTAAGAEDRDHAASQAARTAEALDVSLRRAVACSPADAYAWYAMYLARNAGGFRADSSPLLDMSYRTGPREGWVSVNRNRTALSWFFVLPPELKEAALAEFKAMVNDGYYRDTAYSFIRAAPLLKTFMRAQLDELDADKRRAFSEMLVQFDYDGDLPVAEMKRPASQRGLLPTLP